MFQNIILYLHGTNILIKIKTINDIVNVIQLFVNTAILLRRTFNHTRVQCFE